MANLAKIIHGIDEPAPQARRWDGTRIIEPSVLRSELIGALQAFVEAEEAFRAIYPRSDFDDMLGDAYDNAKAVLLRVYERAAP